MDLIFSPFKNPKGLSAAPGDTNWHKLSNFPPTQPMTAGAFLITVTTTTLGAGSGAFIQMNVGSVAPANDSAAFPLHAGATLLMGGGVNDLWYRLITSSDVFYCTYEG